MRNEFQESYSKENISKINIEERYIIEHLGGTQGWMKAPNGKDSNLSEKQWVIARTPDFYKWFGVWDITKKNIDVIKIDKAPFNNKKDAIAYLNSKKIITEKNSPFSNLATNGKGEIGISKNSIEEMLNPSQLKKNVNYEIHYAALANLLEIIKKSEISEVHPDYKKNESGERNQNSKINPDRDVIVLYGAVEYQSQIYRVKTSLHKSNILENNRRKAYAYNVSEIEVLSEQPEIKKSEEIAGQLPNQSEIKEAQYNASLSMTILLHNVRNFNQNLTLSDYLNELDANGEPSAERVKEFIKNRFSEPLSNTLRAESHNHKLKEKEMSMDSNNTENLNKEEALLKYFRMHLKNEGKAITMRNIQDMTEILEVAEYDVYVNEDNGKLVLADNQLGEYDSEITPEDVLTKARNLVMEWENNRTVIQEENVFVSRFKNFYESEGTYSLDLNSLYHARIESEESDYLKIRGNENAKRVLLANGYIEKTTDGDSEYYDLWAGNLVCMDGETVTFKGYTEDGKFRFVNEMGENDTEFTLTEDEFEAATIEYKSNEQKIQSLTAQQRSNLAEVGDSHKLDSTSNVPKNFYDVNEISAETLENLRQMVKEAERPSGKSYAQPEKKYVPLSLERLEGEISAGNVFDNSEGDKKYFDLFDRNGESVFSDGDLAEVIDINSEHVLLRSDDPNHNKEFTMTPEEFKIALEDGIAKENKVMKEQDMDDVEYVKGVAFPKLDDEILDEKITVNKDALRAAMIAVAGQHNLLLYGKPGCGKTLLASKLSAALPALTETEKTEVEKVWGAAGLGPYGSHEKPFRRPHQSATLEGICGGGQICRPGELSLANKGVLMFDEAQEFRAHVLQAMKLPLERGSITLSRAGESYKYPTDTQVIMTANPCACGNFGENSHICLCSKESEEKYWEKMKPVTDLVEIKAHVYSREDDRAEEKFVTVSPREIREKIAGAIAMQRERGMSNHDIGVNIRNESGDNLFQKYFEGKSREELGLQEKVDLLPHTEKETLAKTIKQMYSVARTIADLDGRDIIERNDFKEAALYVDFSADSISSRNVRLSHLAENMAERKLLPPVNTVTPDMTGTQRKIHEMFDSLFNESEKSISNWTKNVVTQAGKGDLGLYPEFMRDENKDKWWMRSVEHAVNSGGTLWQSSHEREELFKKFGIKGSERHIKDPDKEYGLLMYKYLKDTGALSDELYHKTVDEEKERRGKADTIKKGATSAERHFTEKEFSEIEKAQKTKGSAPARKREDDPEPER